MITMMAQNISSCEKEDRLSWAQCQTCPSNPGGIPVMEKLKHLFESLSSVVKGVSECDAHRLNNR